MLLLTYAIRRLMTIIPTLLGLIILTFFLARVIPADPAALIAGESASLDQIEALRQQYGFNEPLYVQLGVYLSQLARGDLGTSIYTGRLVIEDLWERFPATLELTFVAIGVAVLLGVPLGILSALKRNSWLDHLLRLCTRRVWPSRGSGWALCCNCFLSWTSISSPWAAASAVRSRTP